MARILFDTWPHHMRSLISRLLNTLKITSSGTSSRLKVENFSCDAVGILCLVLLADPKMFWASSNILGQTNSWIAFITSPKLLRQHKNWISFGPVQKIWDWHNMRWQKAFGPAQNMSGPVEGRSLNFHCWLSKSPEHNSQSWTRLLVFLISLGNLPF